MLKRLRFVLCALAVLIALSGVGRPMAAALSELTDLKGVDELKMLFNQDAGKVRLVLLVSPT